MPLSDEPLPGREPEYHLRGHAPRYRVTLFLTARQVRELDVLAGHRSRSRVVGRWIELIYAAGEPPGSR